MKINFDTIRFDEAFLYMAGLPASWDVETQIFPRVISNDLADEICQYEGNPFSETFSNEAGFKAKFYESLWQILYETLAAEKKYRSARERAGVDHSKKSITQARIDIKSMLGEMGRFEEYLFDSSAPPGRFLESLRQACRETTLCLLDYLAISNGLTNVNFQRSFENQDWSPQKVSDLRKYLKVMHSRLARSTRPGGSAHDKISPVMSYMMYRLGVLYAQYSGKAPTRTSTSELQDTVSDVRSVYREKGVFKSLCFESYKMVEHQLPEFSAYNTPFQNESFLDGIITSVVKALKNNTLTYP